MLVCLGVPDAWKRTGSGGVDHVPSKTLPRTRMLMGAHVSSSWAGTTGRHEDPFNILGLLYTSFSLTL